MCFILRNFPTKKSQNDLFCFLSNYLFVFIVIDAISNNLEFDLDILHFLSIPNENLNSEFSKKL